MKLGIAADHGGFVLKTQIIAALETAGHDVKDYGAYRLEKNDDYPDFVIPMARAVADAKLERGVAVCGSGVGACIAVNKVPGARAALITDTYSARQGVEDDDMNIICLGGRVTGNALAWEIIQVFIQAQFQAKNRFCRRLSKIENLERSAGKHSRRGS
jgi:ribose 5-phosphate isomerase B